MQQFHLRWWLRCSLRFTSESSRHETCRLPRQCRCCAVCNNIPWISNDISIWEIIWDSARSCCCSCSCCCCCCWGRAFHLPLVNPKNSRSTTESNWLTPSPISLYTTTALFTTHVNFRRWSHNVLSACVSPCSRSYRQSSCLSLCRGPIENDYRVYSDSCCLYLFI